MSGREVEAAVLDNGEDISRWTGLADHGNGIMVIVLGLFALYRYLRAFVYPCLTLFELHNATKIVDNAYRTARNPSIPDAPEWYGIANDYLSLNIEASRIREKGLQLSLWNTYVGFHPKLMFDIARCYTKYEELRRRILTARERDLQSHFGAEQYRRRLASRTSSAHIQNITLACASGSSFRTEDCSSRPCGSSL
ncbi:hypothetical protein E1B28_010532 [Marasmius oreades]|uniref:Uncharacterized protein n=1 Tax=Marasmius oreades TaxID=181124 RepID=A0A9P7UR82_9AGAR|nr:uncharacterized protein E1B28_010532 [Marasmius oreades]KAG7091502.1 hypothetical protein E1B28_010532 [Marasmius oreades]